MIACQITKSVLGSINTFPSVTVIAPIQSGKTTLVKSLFPDYKYINLENFDQRLIAEEYPRSIFSSHQRIIIDEEQTVPKIFSYIQNYLDSGLYKMVIIGSNQFNLNAQIAQSLAGRNAIYKLLPFSIKELKSNSVHLTIDEWMIKGFYPAIHNKNQNPHIAYRSYFETYIQKEVRQILNVKNISLFEKFVIILVGRIGNIINFSTLSNEVGASVHTLQS